MKIESNPRRVANYLKRMVNKACKEDFTWFDDVTDEEPILLDILDAIDILDQVKPRTYEVEGAEKI